MVNKSIVICKPVAAYEPAAVHKYEIDPKEILIKRRIKRRADARALFYF
jgi:hypothetical protein